MAAVRSRELLLLLQGLVAGILLEFGNSENVGTYLPDLSFVNRWKRQSCNNQFSCGSGECIPEGLVCNGERNCRDRSDETTETCLQRLLPVLAVHLEPPLISFVDKCPPSQYRCSYGKCIEFSKRCNGQKDCIDGSDEDSCTPLGPVNSTLPVTSTISAPTAAPPAVPASNCKLPELPTNGKYHIIACDKSPCGPGTVADKNAVLQFMCEKGFELSSKPFVWCDGSSWSSVFPTCQKVLCPPLENPSRKITCTHSNRRVDCSKDMEPGTLALVSCNDYYTASVELFTDTIFCQENGMWSNIIHSCIPECGVPSVKGRPFISLGFTITTQEIPWHVAIYRDDENQIPQIRCGGSIIRPNIILTAAHCFWDETTKKTENLNMYKLVAGKFHRDWNQKDPDSQNANIKSVIIHPEYNGMDTNFAQDIAIVILNRSLEITADVRLICLDTENKHPSNFEERGLVGIVAGWGYTEKQVLSEELQAVKLPVWDKRACINSLPNVVKPYAAFQDKFCAGTTNNMSVCRGDSGGGFGVQFSNNSQYFLMGIVSAGVGSLYENCDTSQLALFTKISEHITFIKQYLTLLP